MKSASAQRGNPRSDSGDAAARKRAAVETYARNENALRRTARRYSFCQDDADEALQRALEILLRKAPGTDPRYLVKWTQTVVKHEALAVRAERERILASPLAPGDEDDWVALLPAGGDGPAEKAERREAIARSREALQALKPDELRALTLLAEGYSYAEIGEITSWSQTKINRCLAEGRERFRSLVSRSEDGRRCAEMRPLISSFCDGELEGKRVAELREHLRACASCRATLRTYRAAPAAAAALAPAIPLHRSLLERAHDALAEVATRFGGSRGPDAAVSQGLGGGGLGAAGLAKVAAVCIGTAGGAAACVATGLVPAPVDPGGDRAKPALERHVDAAAQRPESVEYQPAPAPDPEPQPQPDAHPAPAHQVSPEPAPAPAEPATEASEPAASSGAVEYAPPPAPEPAPVAEPAPVQSSESGSPAGEFGP
jgi:RNA polymerase sigma factor (sigma-70 family)